VPKECVACFENVGVSTEIIACLSARARRDRMFAPLVDQPND